MEKYSYKILIVDDRVESLKVLVAYIQESFPRCTIYQTISGNEAIKIVNKTSPDLIITDWDMAEMSGIEFIRELKNRAATKDIPVIMATGVMLTSENLKIALEAGAFDYLRKPIDPVELVARVNSALLISLYHNQSIELKNQELAENALYLVKNNEFNISITDKLSKFVDFAELKGSEKVILNSIIQEIDNHTRTNSWQRFNVAFQSVYPNFNRTLLDRYPDLSAAELKLCTFIRMGMNIKDVASLLSLNPASVKVARSRLRKKLDLDTTENLDTFLATFG